MCASWCGLSRKFEGFGGEVVGEGVPLPVEQDASEAQDELGAIASPAHPGPVQAHSDQVADGPLDSAGTDIEVLASELGVAHAAAVFGEVLHDLEQSLP